MFNPSILWPRVLTDLLVEGPPLGDSALLLELKYGWLGLVLPARPDRLFEDVPSEGSV